MATPKKVLLAGGSFSGAPIFFALKKRGFHVTVCGRDRAEPCHQYADASLFVDYSVKEDVLAEVKAGDFDYLVPTCNDYSYLSCAWVAAQCGFPGYDSYETTQILHTKHRFRQYMMEHDFPVPAAVRYEPSQESAIAQLSYPLFVKPVDVASGRGCTKVVKSEDLAVAIDHALKTSRYGGGAVIEEFVPGELHSHSAFIHKGKIVCDFFVDEFCTVYPYYVNCSNHPSRLNDKVRAGMRETMARLIAMMGLCDGVLHTQFIADYDRFWVIECMRRAPGDIYGHLVELSTGVDYFDFYVRPFINEVVPTVAENPDPKFVARHSVTSPTQIVSSGFSHRIPGKYTEVIPLRRSAEILREAPYGVFGLLFAEFSSRQQLFDIAPSLADYVTIHPLEENRQ